MSLKERIFEVLQGPESLNEKAHIVNVMIEHQAESNDFWKHIILTENGKLDVEQVKKELEDYYFMMEQVPKVYMHITDDQMSKPNYYAHAVIAVADDCQTKDTEEAIRDAVKDYESAAESSRKLTKKNSDILHPNGDGPEQPSLCDIVAYVRSDISKAVHHLDWMIKTLDYKNQDTGIHNEDSPELKDAKEFLKRSRGGK